MKAAGATSSFQNRPYFPEEVVAFGLQSAFPQGALSDHIQCFWSLDNGSALAEPASSQLTSRKLYPDGGLSLMIRLDRSTPTATLLFNRQTMLQPFPLSEPLLSVRFNPGVLHGLFGLSPAECLSDDIEFAGLLQGNARPGFSFLLEQLLELDAAERMNRLEEWFTAYVGQKTPYRRRLVHLPNMLDSPHGQLTEVASDLGMSTRTLERHCMREIGMAPSALLECLRMRNARRLLAAPELSLAELALACGYYDQAHFSRAFSDFVGEAPGAYRKRKLSHFYKA